MLNKVEPLVLSEANEHLKKQSHLFLVDNEVILMAFKSKRDRYYFTNLRLLVEDHRGITGKKTDFKCCPYHNIVSFSVESSGTIDFDCELKIKASMEININFDKKKVDIWKIQSFLGPLVFGGGAVATVTPTYNPVEEDSSKRNQFLNFVTGDSVKVDTSTLQSQLQTQNMLLSEELVELAYKYGRDMIVFTNKRVVIIDVKGFSGKKVELTSIRYDTIKGYSVETVGSFLDRDATFSFFTNINQNLRRIDTDIRHSQSDIYEVLSFMNNKFLGLETILSSASIPDMKEAPVSSLMKYLSDDMRQLNAAEINDTFHKSPAILQPSEICEISFQGRRDLVLFTTKRVLFVDKKGFSGKKMAFSSYPYTSMKSVYVTTAGGSLDRDCELGFETDIWWDPPKCNGCDPGCSEEDPTPGNSCIEFDINRNAIDLLSLFRYLDARVKQATQKKTTSQNVPSYLNMGTEQEERVSITTTPPNALDKLLAFMGESSAVSVSQANAEFGARGPVPVLPETDQILMAFKGGRDFSFWTSRGILTADRRGITGKRTTFKMIPYSSIRWFAAEGNGSFDHDSELEVGLCTRWNPIQRWKYRAAAVDIIAIQKFLSQMVLHRHGQASAGMPNITVPSNASTSLGKFLDFIGENYSKRDPGSMEAYLKRDVDILVDDEAVELAYQGRRDMWIITSHRVLLIDVKGMTGKKVEFKSFPYQYCRAFMGQTAGHCDRSIEVFYYVRGYDIQKTSLSKKSAEIPEICHILAKKLLRI